MRKTSSFHLEEDIFNEIIKYQTEHNLSSRNIALERMILEFRSLKKELDDKASLVEFAKSILSNNTNIKCDIEELKTNESKNTSVVDSTNTNKPKNSKFRGSIKDVFDNMPDGKDEE